jgi:hypothetical protein
MAEVISLILDPAGKTIKTPAEAIVIKRNSDRRVVIHADTGNADVVDLQFRNGSNKHFTHHPSGKEVDSSVSLAKGEALVLKINEAADVTSGAGKKRAPISLKLSNPVGGGDGDDIIIDC